MIDPDCNDYENAMSSLELASKYGLQVEVFCTAMAYYRNNKTLTVSEAFKASQYDWDVCVPFKFTEEELTGAEWMRKKEEERGITTEDVEEFNDHMKGLDKG